jgi:hypothetical protein
MGSFPDGGKFRPMPPVDSCGLDQRSEDCSSSAKFSEQRQAIAGSCRSGSTALAWNLGKLAGTLTSSSAFWQFRSEKPNTQSNASAPYLG